MIKLPSSFRAWLPDDDSQLFRLYDFGPSGLKDYGSVTLVYTAKFDPFLSLDCAMVEGVEGSNFAI